MNTTRTLVIGAGQAGLALSRFLTHAGHEHVLLERGRLGERWRSERPDSLTLLTPNWLNALPGSRHDDADGFLDRDGFVAYLDRYASSFGAPVLEGRAVTAVERDGRGFRVEATGGAWRAREVVIATGDCDVPALPGLTADVPTGVAQLHASAYRRPEALAPGGVLVVGAGASGQQLARELAQAGRRVVLAVGRHGRLPRRYRGCDVWTWLDRIGYLDTTIDAVADPVAARRQPSIALSGARGGERLDLGVLLDDGVELVGRLVGVDDGRARFADDLEATMADAERRLGRVLARIDARHDAAGAPDPPPALVAPPARTTLDLARAGIGTVIWATGYRRAYPWLRLPALDADGELVQRRGATDVAGLSVLGLRFQHRRSSHFIGRVGRDAEELAARIVARAETRRARPRPTSRDRRLVGSR
ncbi:MAG: NAD(P)/FAD-dependent oxidoreductase [Thermoleophilia bacterium]